MTKRAQVGILGGGAWGTACATVLAENGHDVLVWCYEQEIADCINEKRVNERYLKDVELAKNIQATADLKTFMEHSEWIFEAIPTPFIRTILKQARAYATPHHKWVAMSKGIEQGTLHLPADIIIDVLADPEVFALGGPNYARDLARQAPTATTVAGDTIERARACAQLLCNDYFRPYLSDDTHGVQAAGAMKNIITLIVAIAEGAGYQENTTAFLLTRGFSEIAQIVELLGGKHRTVYGLAGVGDFILTSTGTQSRNKRAGRMIGEGRTIEDVEKAGITAEGINALKAVHQLIGKHDLDLPLCTFGYRVVFEALPVADMIKALMCCPLQPE